MGMHKGTLSPTLPFLGLLHRILGPQKTPQNEGHYFPSLTLPATIPPAFTCLANKQTHTPLVRGRSREAPHMRCCRYPTRLARAFPPTPRPAVRLRQGRSLGGARFRRRECSRYLLALFAFSGGNNARIPPTGQLQFVVRGPRPQVRTGCSEVPQSSHVRASPETLAKSPLSGPYKSC